MSCRLSSRPGKQATHMGLQFSYSMMAEREITLNFVNPATPVVSPIFSIWVSLSLSVVSTIFSLFIWQQHTPSDHSTRLCPESLLFIYHRPLNTHTETLFFSRNDDPALFLNSHLCPRCFLYVLILPGDGDGDNVHQITCHWRRCVSLFVTVSLMYSMCVCAAAQTFIYRLSDKIDVVFSFAHFFCYTPVGRSAFAVDYPLDKKK